MVILVTLIVVFVTVMSTLVKSDKISENTNDILNSNAPLALNTNGLENVNAVSMIPSQNENTNENSLSNINAVPSSSTNTYENSSLGLSLQYPSIIVPQSSFAGSYLIPDSWSALSTQSTTGNKIVSFILPGSNQITSAGLRIGTSNVSSDVTNCLVAPTYAVFEKNTTTLNGNTYTVLTLSDAAMNHYSTIKSYRIEKNNTCYVVDTYVTGTNPEVYDPKPTPPFTKDEAFKNIDIILRTIEIN